MLISVTMYGTNPRAAANRLMLWLANFTWISLVAMIASLALLFVTYTHAGGQIPADGKSLALGTSLPAGSIALLGYANRLLIVVYCTWAVVAARVAARNR
jgi:hypothetical protein